MDAADFMPSAAAIASIRKDIERYEAERVSASRSIYWRVPLFLVLLLIAVTVLAWVFNLIADRNEQWFSPPHVFLYAVAFIGAFYLYSRAVRPVSRFQQSFRQKILPATFGFIENVRYAHGEQPPSFSRMPQNLVGPFNRELFDDVIIGRHEGFAFELYEAALAQRSGKVETTVFSGAIIAFDMIRPFPGELVATRKSGEVAGFFKGIFGERFDELQSGVPALDAAYEFRTDNAAAALPLVTGRMAKALEWLHEMSPDAPARIALKGADGFLLLPLTRNYFELPPSSQKLDYKTHIEPMITDMGTLLAMVSLVRKAGVSED